MNVPVQENYSIEHPNARKCALTYAKWQYEKLPFLGILVRLLNILRSSCAWSLDIPQLFTYPTLSSFPSSDVKSRSWRRLALWTLPKFWEETPLLCLLHLFVIQSHIFKSFFRSRWLSFEPFLIDCRSGKSRQTCRIKALASAFVWRYRWSGRYILQSISQKFLSKLQYAHKWPPVWIERLSWNRKRFNIWLAIPSARWRARRIRSPRPEGLLVGRWWGLPIISRRDN